MRKYKEHSFKKWMVSLVSDNLDVLGVHSRAIYFPHREPTRCRFTRVLKERSSDTHRDKRCRLNDKYMQGFGVFIQIRFDTRKTGVPTYCAYVGDTRDLRARGAIRIPVYACSSAKCSRYTVGV